MKIATVLLGAIVLAASAAASAQDPAPDPTRSQFSPGMRSVKFEAQDFERSAAFYIALGMKIGAKRDTTWDLVWDGPTMNSGIQMTTPEYARRGEMVRGGTMMIFMTPDILATVERLRDAGFNDVPEPRSMGGMASVVMLRDPDGNRIELLGPPFEK